MNIDHTAASLVIKAIIFDLDGTLIDGAEDLRAAANALLAADDLAPIDLATITSFIGNGMGALVQRCYALRGGERFNVAERLDRFKHIYETHGHRRTELYPGVRVALDTLRRHYKLALCTNKDRAPTLSILRHLNLDTTFDGVIAGDALPVNKPDPAMLRAAAAACGTALDDVIYVGDSEVDAQMCKAAGAPFILFEGGYRKASIEAIAPDRSFSDYAALPGVLAEWRSRRKAD